MKQPKGIISRRLALEVLIQIDQQNVFATVALSEVFARKELSTRDRAFMTALVLGVSRNKSSLDSTIQSLSSKSLEKLPTPLLNVLRLGLFQLNEMPDIPQSAVLNTCVELAKIVGHIGQSRFTNGILRTYLRQKPEQSQSLTNKYSMPNWIVDRWLKNFGEEETTKLLTLAQKPAPLTLRTCELSITPERLESILKSKGFDSKLGSLVPSCLLIKKHPKGAPQNISGYSEGLFSIQDEASAFVSVVVDPKPNEFIVDLCAAPGSKTIHLAELMNNSGQVIAIDKSIKRLELLKENQTRLGLTNIQIIEADGRTVALKQQADRVLLDAPCTGTGVISKRPDLRYHRQSEDIAKLVILQRELLNHAARLVKPGGVLVYSTCSIEPEENIENMTWFLENHKKFQSSDLTPYIPKATLDQWIISEKAELGTLTIQDNARKGFIQLLPSRHDVSGFFVCRLINLPK